MATVTVVGGGLSGLVASIACREAGAEVRLFETHRELGGRARSTRGPFVANLGSHALYSDGPLWRWLWERGLAEPSARPRLGGLRFRHRGRLRATPPAALARALKLIRRDAPADLDFRSWITRECGMGARELCNLAGVFTFDADPGRLSAAFVWERLVRVFATVPPAARYPIGGWQAMIDRLAARARELGVAIETGATVDELPARPVVMAGELEAARKLLGDQSLRWESARVALLDLGLVAHRGDPFIVSDLDEAGWVERFTASDPGLAPAGHSLVQAQLGLRSGEPLQEGVARLERILDLGFEGWRGREVWRRRSVLRGRTGALDPPGTTWRDRPAVDRGDGVFLAGDMVAAPGLLAEVGFGSAIEASEGALRELRVRSDSSRPHGARNCSSRARSK